MYMYRNTYLVIPPEPLDGFRYGVPCGDEITSVCVAVRSTNTVIHGGTQ